MGIEVDIVNLDITLTGDGYLVYGGHFITISENDGLELFCTSCGSHYSFHTVPDGPYKWESILYLLGRYSAECDGDGSDLQNRLQDTLQDYAGKPADQGNIAALEHDIRKVVGDDISIEMQNI